MDAGGENLARRVQQLQLGGAGARHRRRGRSTDVSASSADAARAGGAGAVTSGTAGAATVGQGSLALHQTEIRALMLRSFQSPDDMAFSLQSESGQPVPGFQVVFGNLLQRAAHLLAAVDEDGVISIIDAFEKRLETQQPRTSILQCPRRRWLAHRNAIFDVIWTHDDKQLVTASGDLFVCGWDVECQRPVFTLKGHQMSVKCVRQVPEHDHLFASGARDGNVLIWDTRTNGSPVATLDNVHAVPEASSGANAMFTSPPSARKRKKPAGVSSPRSVTCIEFGASGYEIVTAGAVDSVVKFWDVRRLTTAHHFKSTAFSSRPPVRAISCSSRVGAQHGISSLAFDHTRSKLLVNVLNDAIKLVDIHAAPQTPPIVQCGGHLATSFYVKAAFSPESDFVIGGSGDGAAFIWSAVTANRSAAGSTLSRFPIAALKGHTSEVNGVAWHKHDFTQVATSSDDGTVRCWNVNRNHQAQQQRSAVPRSRASEEEGRRKKKSFVLTREDDRSWRNWSEFCAQPNGFSYPVAISPSLLHSGHGDEESIDVDNDAENAKLKSPFLIRRSGELLRRRDDAEPTPPRRPVPSPSQPRRPTPSPPQTLLDFWRR